MRIFGSGHTRGLLAIAVLAIAARAEATVTQVDGTILPDTDTNDLQAVLDAYETPAGTLNAVKDAAEVPQIFKPRTSSPVVFIDVREGADYEDSFGWYNVGDDVSTVAGRAANLHPVLGCGVPMNGTGDAKTHKGNPAYYIQNANDGSTISVDFAAEQTAGRYKGGFIGFYLITPEDPNSPDKNPLPGRNPSCGDFKNDTNGLSLFGFIYFTQKDLNNDGDFVHHLVYTSKKASDRFFFGFEDLFRGGDNDYDDMTIRIEGLTPPCVPSAEVCDGIDNDCDGLVDGADPNLTGTGDACTCDGNGLTCDNGPRLGVCQQGVTACTAGALTCHGTGAPTGEICDGKDNNCDGQIDNNPSGTGGTCDGTDADACKDGAIVCTNGALVCNDDNLSSVEKCDGIDNNCDGQIDEGDPEGGGSCGSSLGVCKPGIQHCVGGTLVCQGQTAGSAEKCDGLDNDCDGVIDDTPTDVGQTCGATDVGECSYGQTICTNGTLSCAGEIGASPEKCDSKDNDCDGQIDDNPVDAGQACGSSTGECRPGVYVCSMGGLVCTGGIGPTAEACDGKDNDCNGLVDDMVPGENQACGSGMGACAGGMTKCIAGTMQCVGGSSAGTEICNGVDDDCDGVIDDGDLCNGGTCDKGDCAPECLGGEFPCESGKVCNANNKCVDDPCFNVTCPNDAEGNLQMCSAGVCKSVCDTITCPNSLVCRGTDGACVRDTCDYLPSKCSLDQLCIDSECAANPCNGVTCGSGEFCRAGSCVASCQNVICDGGDVCRDGACVASGCAKACDGNTVCNPDTGACTLNRCVGIVCPGSNACEPITGKCVADPCLGVVCPGEQSCSQGQCGLNTAGGVVTTGGGGGCSADNDSSLGGLLALAAFALIWRRRRAPAARAARTTMMRPALLAGIAALSIGASGCHINDYCLDCEVPKDSGTGSGGDDDGGTGGNGDGGGSSAACDPNNVRTETCNNKDDDCNGQVDENFNLQTDGLNCGACGNKCSKPGAQTQCVAGECKIVACFPGNIDRNGDITGPYASSNGCEYGCFQSNNGVEACDGLDNNCDGVIDEGIDKLSDPANCGVCGRVCEFYKATAHCTLGTCLFDPATDCAPGYYDDDGKPGTGCEYACTKTNNGVEACDLKDNDCDGDIDETFDTQTDPNNCGKCGQVCAFAHATATCGAGTCKFDPATGCAAGYYDADGKQINGCEYQCTKTNGGVEICDGKDNDCDGVADDNVLTAGDACASSGTPTGACIANGKLACVSGVMVCANATQPIIETCNNVDDDCDGAKDDGVSQSCYTGPNGTSGVGVCHAGAATCSNGTYGTCTGEVKPSTEQCNNLDDDCNGKIDDGPGGAAIAQSCYSGPNGTAGVGTCVAGTKTCAFGAFGACTGEIVPTANDVCGDNLDTDCDGKNDATEGCLATDAEKRLDSGTGGETAAAQRHSYDVVLARGGFPLGSKVYAAWSQLTAGGTTEVYFRASLDGGTTWGNIINTTNSGTSGITGNKVKPFLAVAPAAAAGDPDRIVLSFQTVTSGVRDIHVAYSTNGTTFTQAAVGGTTAGALDTGGDSFHHVVAIRGSSCIVAWEQLNTSSLIRDINSRGSTDGCATFTGSPMQINKGTGTYFAGRPQVGITATGGAVWAWREQRANSTRDVFAAASANVTTAPSSNVSIDVDAAQESDFPVLVVNESAAYLAWQEVATASNGGADVMFSRSTNGGAAWSTPIVIDDPSGEVSSSFTPTLAVDPKAAGNTDDVVALAWEDRRQGSQVFAAFSTNGGASFAAAKRASSANGAPITGGTTVPQMTSLGSDAFVVAYQNQIGTNKPHVEIVSTIDSGATWTYSQKLADAGSGAAILPQVVATISGGVRAAVTVWTDFRNNQTNGDIYATLSH